LIDILRAMRRLAHHRSVSSWLAVAALLSLASTPAGAILPAAFNSGEAPALSIAKARSKARAKRRPRPKRKPQASTAPQLLNPESGAKLETAVLKPVAFAWDASSSVAMFDIELARDQKFAGIINRRTVAGRAFEMVVQPEPELWWRVCSLDSMGRRDACSAPASFSYQVVDQPQPVTSPPEPAAPVPQPKVASDTPTVPEESPAVEESMSIAPAERLTFHVGPRVSFFYNFGAVTTARGALELGYRIPVLTHFVGFALSVGYYTAAVEASDPDGQMTLQSRLHGVPMDLVGTFVFTTDLVDLYAGAGPSLDLGYTTVQLSGYPDLVHSTVDFGLVVVAGAERMLGPGAVFVDARYALTTESSGAIEHNPGGLNIGLGYRFRIW